MKPKLCHLTKLQTCKCQLNNYACHILIWRNFIKFCIALVFIHFVANCHLFVCSISLLIWLRWLRQPIHQSIPIREWRQYFKDICHLNAATATRVLHQRPPPANLNKLRLFVCCLGAAYVKCYWYSHMRCTKQHFCDKKQNQTTAVVTSIYGSIRANKRQKDL